MRCRLLLGLLGLTLSPLAHAHGSDAPFEAWSFDPLVVFNVVLVGTAYTWRVRRLWRVRGANRDIRHWQTACFGLGLAVLFLALAGPVDALAAVSFSGHMIQHMLLMAVAAPLLALGAPLAPLMRGAPRALRRVVLRYGATLTQPFTAFLLHGLTVWFWHAPGAFEAALASEPLHMLEHATFLFTALLFWRSLIQTGQHATFGYGAGAFWSLATVVHSGMLGALLTFASAPLYPSYLHIASPLALSPLEDQQLAGLIMWIPTGSVYLLAGLVSVAAWLKAVETTQGR